MSNYSEFIKSQKEKDMKFFFGEDYKMISNKYFNFKRIIDDDNIIIVTNNLKVIKNNMVMLVDNDKAVYLKEWQFKEIHNYDEGINTYAVKLNRKYFKPYQFKFQFEGFDFHKEMTFDDLHELAKVQEEENLPFAKGHMH